MLKQKKVIIWTKGIDDFLSGTGKVGGLTVQMYFWAQTFNMNNWKVYSFTASNPKILSRIHFLNFPTKRYIGVFIELIYSFFYICTKQPDVILFRGAGRALGYVTLYSKITRTKLIHLGASDTDFHPGNELIKAKHDIILFRRGMKRVKYFIVQNDNQRELLNRHYQKTNCIRIPNIWISDSHSQKQKTAAKSKNDYILWVSNFRSLKRPNWFIDLSKQFSDIDFVMIGSPIDYRLYDHCKSKASTIPNLHFLGKQPFNATNHLFEKAIFFICTSESEGFPNTFLQAWSNNIPVITTFDPSDIVKKKQLGIVVKNAEELNNATNQLLNNAELYQRIQKNIKAYFNETHNPQKAYEKVINLLHL